MELALLQADALTGASDFWLWFAWGGMTLATLYFLYLATQGGTGHLHHYITCAVITLWAAFSYLVMATGSGIAAVADGDGVRLFYYARYIDWLVTTPLILLTLIWVAFGGTIQRNVRVALIIIGADVLMIITGVLASLAGGGSFPGALMFLVSSVFFLVVLYFIWSPQGLNGEANRGNPEGGANLFFRLAVMLTVLWFFYPVVWILGTEGSGAVSNGVEVFFYAVLDILAKIGFGIVLLTGLRQAQRA